jgi:tetratricopeptide (TPR) repeat protein
MLRPYCTNEPDVCRRVSDGSAHRASDSASFPVSKQCRVQAGEPCSRTVQQSPRRALWWMAMDASDTTLGWPALKALLLGGLCTLFMVSSAAARDFEDATPGEVARLPEYCLHVQGGRETKLGRNQQRREELFAQMGQTFNHMHHYCWALHRVAQAGRFGISPQLRANLFTSSIKDIYYVLERAPTNFVLTPELYLRIGQYHAALGQALEALEAFEKSRIAKADYWPPYVETANLNVRIGRRSEAEQVLRRGLEIMPNEQNLLQALSRLPPSNKPMARVEKQSSTRQP